MGKILSAIREGAAAVSAGTRYTAGGVFRISRRGFIGRRLPAMAELTRAKKIIDKIRERKFKLSKDETAGLDSVEDALSVISGHKRQGGKFSVHESALVDKALHQVKEARKKTIRYLVLLVEAENTISIFGETIDRKSLMRRLLTRARDAKIFFNNRLNKLEQDNKSLTEGLRYKH